MCGGTWSDENWAVLDKRVDEGKVTPVLGAGASIDIVGGAGDIVNVWAESSPYPFGDAPSLADFSQYIASNGDRAQPGEFIQDYMTERLSALVLADIDDKYNPYRYLPSLPIPVWLTTNYDDLIQRGLRTHNKSPRIGVSAWSPPSNRSWDVSKYDLADYTPTADDPLAFHLHGRYDDDASMVITQHDYLDFLEQMGRSKQVLPEMVQDAIAKTSLLFIGYSFSDTNLQLLLRAWELRRLAFAVQPLPSWLPDGTEAAFTAHYTRFLHDITGGDFRLFWGTASEFCAGLDDYRKRTAS